MQSENFHLFKGELETVYTELFERDARYLYSRTNTTPKALAEKMTTGLLTGAASKDGQGIKSVCKKLGIKPTYKEIKLFLLAGKLVEK